MQPDFTDKSFGFNEPPQKKTNPLLMILAGFGGFILLLCGGCFVGLMFIGAAGPETSVYVRGNIPQSYLDRLRDIGGLEADEQVEYFYSDALYDIEGGFSYVSDRKVAIYLPDDNPPLTVIPFDAIAGAELDRDESFLTDSTITLEANGDYIFFPVSSEEDRDVEFYETIRRRSPNIQ